MIFFIFIFLLPVCFMIHYNTADSSLNSSLITTYQIRFSWDDLLYRKCLIFVTAFRHQIPFMPAEMNNEPKEPRGVEYLWLGTCLINLKDFYIRAVDFHQRQPGRHLCFQALLQCSSCRAYIPLEYYETDLISQACCRLRYGSFVLFILA